MEKEGEINAVELARKHVIPGEGSKSGKVHVERFKENPAMAETDTWRHFDAISKYRYSKRDMYPYDTFQ